MIKINQFIHGFNFLFKKTRLVVHENCNEREYDCAKYQDQLFHFNKTERTFCYKHDVNVVGLDHCYDCRAEVYVFEKYIELGEITQMSSKTKIQCVEYINQQLQAASKEINMEIILNDFFYKGKYFFTAFRYGTQIENEIQLRSVLIRETIRRRPLRQHQARNDLNLVANMGNLNLND